MNACGADLQPQRSIGKQRYRHAYGQEVYRHCPLLAQIFQLPASLVATLLLQPKLLFGTTRI